MTRRIAFALAVVSVLVAALLLLRTRDDRAGRASRRAAGLPGFDDRQVESLVLEARHAHWRLDRGTPGWRIVSPVDDVADPRAVEALIGAASRAPIVKTIVAPEALSTYGLEPPVARLTVSGNASRTLELGRVAPTGDAVFVRLAGRPEVLLLGLPEAAPLAEIDPESLRARTLVDLARSELVGLEIVPGGVRLTRSRDGWWISAPHRFPASAASIDKLLGALYGVKVIGWDDLGSRSDPKYGLGADALSITLRTGAEARVVTLGAEAAAGHRFVTSEGRGGILIADALPPDSIPSDPAVFRETRLTNVNRYDVTRLDYVSGAKRWAASRKDDSSWATDTGESIPAERVYTLLVGMLGAETVAWSHGDLQAKPTATLSYETRTESGAGRVAFAGDRATWDAIPGVVFRLASPPPTVAVPPDAP